MKWMLYGWPGRQSGLVEHQWWSSSAGSSGSGGLVVGQLELVGNRSVQEGQIHHHQPTDI